MRTAKIFILILARHGHPSPQSEEGRSALGLYAKYDGRVVDGVTQAVELIDCTNKKRVTVNESLAEAKDRKIALADGDRVGFYLVGHAQSYDTLKPATLIQGLLEERIGAAPKVDDASSGKKKQRAIGVSIDKVCLVLCNSADRETDRLNEAGTAQLRKTGEQPVLVIGAGERPKDFRKRYDADVKEFGKEVSLLAELCRKLAEAGHRPRVAGYVGMITAVGPDDVGANGLTNASLYGTPLKVGQKTHGHDTDSHKLYFVYEPGRGYVEQDRDSWTDKR